MANESHLSVRLDSRTHRELLALLEHAEDVVPLTVSQVVRAAIHSLYLNNIEGH